MNAPSQGGKAWWACAGRPTAAILGFATVALVSTAIVVSADEREIICHPGYAASQRLHGEAYRRLRNAAFARAGVSVEKQCHREDGDDPRTQRLQSPPHPDCLILDHIVPLCLGGTNTLDNLQVQNVRDAAHKDVLEVKMCRAFCAGKLTLEQARSYFRSRTAQ